MKYDVFISYSSKDQKVVEAMCAYLEQHKVRCFVAYRDIPKGVVCAKAIVEALDESKMLVVVFSEEFNLSDQVDREIELASEDKKPILTYRISDAMFKGAKKYYLKNINWIDAFPHPETMFDSLLDNICKLIGRPSSDVNTKPVRNNPVPTPVAKPAYVSASKPASVPADADKVWKVGDYYNVDGKEGVVFWVDETGRHGKIVSVKCNSYVCWCTYEEYIKGLSGIATDKSDGMRNLQSIMKISDWREKYPAFAWCADRGTGWYLPAIDELKELLLNTEVYLKVKRMVIQKDGYVFAMDGTYWSSTENEDVKWSAWYIDMSNRSSGSKCRYAHFKVHAVAAF